MRFPSLISNVNRVSVGVMTQIHISYNNTTDMINHELHLAHYFPALWSVRLSLTWPLTNIGEISQTFTKRHSSLFDFADKQPKTSISMTKCYVHFIYLDSIFILVLLERSVHHMPQDPATHREWQSMRIRRANNTNVMTW